MKYNTNLMNWVIILVDLKREGNEIMKIVNMKRHSKLILNHKFQKTKICNS